MSASQKPLQNVEKEAMEVIWREIGGGIEKRIFAELWRDAREKGLRTYYADHFGRPEVREEAAYTLELMCAGARAEREARAEQGGDGGEAGRRLREAQRGPRREQDEDASIVSTSTALRSEAMALLITELVGEREDVQQYRRDRLPGGLLEKERIGDFLDGLDEDSKLLDIAVDVCDSYGLHLGQSSDLILAATPPELQPILRGTPRTGPTVCQMQFSFAPWTSPEDAAAALRRAQLYRAALDEYRARAAEAKREAIARFEAGETPGRGARAWRGDPALTPFRKRRPRLDVSGKRVSGPDNDSVRVFVFVSRRRRERGERQTWGKMMRDYNALQEEGARRHTKERSFAKTYHRTRAALMAWLPERRARLVLE